MAKIGKYCDRLRKKNRVSGRKSRVTSFLLIHAKWNDSLSEVSISNIFFQMETIIRGITIMENKKKSQKL